MHGLGLHPVTGVLAEVRLSRLTHLQYVFASLLGLPAQKCDHVRCPVRSCPICFLVESRYLLPESCPDSFCVGSKPVVKKLSRFFPCWKQVVCCQKNLRCPSYVGSKPAVRSCPASFLVGRSSAARKCLLSFYVGILEANLL